MKHYYDSIPTARLGRRIVDGDTVVVIGEDGLYHIAVEEYDLHEWERLATSQDEGERLCATVLEFFTPKKRGGLYFG